LIYKKELREVRFKRQVRVQFFQKHVSDFFMRSKCHDFGIVVNPESEDVVT